MSTKKDPVLLKRESGSPVFSAVAAAVLLLVLVLTIAAVWFRTNFVAYEIIGNSMNDTLMEGDWVYGQQGGGAQRGDIVILDVSARPSFADDTIIKRLIAVEGDEISCMDGEIYLRYGGTGEFVRLEEDYAVGSCKDFPVCKVGKGEIFVLGDNRAPSHDSSEEGPLRRDEIVAVVPGWSVGYKGMFTRWENFRGGIRNFFYQLFH